MVSQGNSDLSSNDAGRPAATFPVFCQFHPGIFVECHGFRRFAQHTMGGNRLDGFRDARDAEKVQPLKVGLSLGFLHAMWHLAANIYGASAFHGNLFIVNFLATSVGIVGLRIVTIWIYMRTSSLILGWLTHMGFTGGQLLLVSFELTSGETVVWNSAFSFSVIVIVLFLLIWNKNLKDCKSVVPN